MLGELCLLFVLCLLGCHQWTHRRTLRAARLLPTVPGVTALPLIGLLHYVTRGFIGMSNLLVNGIKTIPSICEARSYCIWLGPHPIITVFGSEDIQTILNSSSTTEKGPEVNILMYAFGNGLVTARGKYWQVLRRHVNPLFHSSNLNQLMPVINTWARDLTLNLSRHVGTGHFDVQHRVNDAVLGSTCYLLFGPEFKVNVDSDLFKKMARSIDNISSLFATRLFKIWLWPDFIFNMRYRSMIEDMDISISKFFQDPLEEFELRIQSQNKRKILDDNYNSHAGLKQGTDDGNSQQTLIDMYAKLHQTHGGISKENLKDEIVTLMLASSESTRLTVSSCLLSVALHPEIQEKLYSEIETVVDNKDSEVSLEHIQNMPYLDQVVKETLRWTLIIPFITRHVQRDIKLSSLTVPAGSTVGVCLTAVHYDPHHYPNPKRFNPDNFLPERVAARPKNTFVPFSGGARGCIGKTYAMMVVKTMVVHVLRKYKLSSDVDIDSLNNVAGLMFSYLEGYRVQLQHR